MSQKEISEQTIKELLERFPEFAIKVQQNSKLVMDAFVGLSYQTIRNIFRQSFLKNKKDDINQEKYLLEIRQKELTITCVFNNDICIEAYFFTDKSINE